MKPQKLIFAIALSLLCYKVSLAQQADSTKIIKKTEYTCSMHPEVISNNPEYCPKCGMKLIEKGSQLKPETPVQAYTCSMHPEITSDKPGKCPKCGMNLIIKGEGSNKGMGCDRMMHGGNGSHRGMMFMAGGAIMIAMMSIIMLFAFR